VNSPADNLYIGSKTYSPAKKEVQGTTQTLGFKSFHLRVNSHDTKEKSGKLPLYKVTFKLIDIDGRIKGSFVLISEDDAVFDQFALDQEFKMEATFDQQKLHK